VEVGLAEPASNALVTAAQAVPGVTAVEAADQRLIVAAEDPSVVTPSLVRALVAAGAGIISVHERATTLEQVYFDVMGVRPDRDGAS
jgi:hypothetical protein